MNSLILAITFLVFLTIAYFSLRSLIKLVLRRCYSWTNQGDRQWLLGAYLLMFISLFLDWGVRKFWIFTWGHSTYLDLITEFGWVYVILIVGWIYPLVFHLRTRGHLRKSDVDIAIANGRIVGAPTSQIAASEFAALRIYTAFNMSAPLVIGFVQSLLSRQLMSYGVIVYWIASVVLFVAVERIIWRAVLTQEDPPQAKPVNRPSAQSGAAKPEDENTVMPPEKSSDTGLVALIGGLVMLALVVLMLMGQRESQPPAQTSQLPAPSPDDLVANDAERYRFLSEDLGIVEDIRTKLQWQRCSLGQTWTGATCAGKATGYTWYEAQRLRPEGWRLPRKDELASLVYCSSGKPAYWNPVDGCEGVYSQPTIWSAAFPNTPETWFWSSSRRAYISGDAWYVTFHSGYVGIDGNVGQRYVRLVRDG